VGRRIGRYTIVREIGRGGMATVFLASDPRHHREVALKLVHPDASAALGSERFRREIDVVAGFQHPHILPLFDSGEADGLLYYVMPLVRGESLRERLRRAGPLPLEEVRRIASNVGAALDYAHGQGVVHRDVKPGNILLDEEHAMVADFGIAHRAPATTSEQITATGVIIGTPAYMSPEQAVGEKALDARSDIYSFGCVVFEMLTGTPPFVAGTAAGILSRHLLDPIPSAMGHRRDLTPAVDRVLAQAMAKDPAARFSSARAFAQALDVALTAGRAAKDNAARRRSLRLAGAGVVALAALALWRVGATDEPAAAPSIAVLPLANMSGDPANEYFADGMTEELTGALAQLGRIRVTPRTTAFAYKGKTDLKRIGEALGVSRVLEGSVRRDGDRVLVLASLFDVSTGDRLWSSRFERPWGSVLALQAELASAIVAQLHLTLLPGEQAQIAGRHPVNAEAYDSYLKGRHFFDLRTAASLEQAAVHFNRALALDSTYARAWAGLADTWSILAWTGSAPPRELFLRARAAAERALALDSTLAEPHLSLGIIHTFHTWDWAAADSAIARAIATDSTMAQAWYWRAWPNVARGRLDAAMAALQRSRALDPLTLITNARIGTLLAFARRYREADSVLRATLEIDPSYPVARVQLARVLSMQGRHEEAIAVLPPDSIRLGSYEAGIAGFVHARAGHRQAALTLVRALESRPYVPAEGAATVHNALGDHDAALTWLERAVDTRGVGLLFLAVEPMYDELRRAPRYRSVVSRVGLSAP
jgi:serine/threonine-protein kinase